MNASPEQQRILLDVAERDQRLARLAPLRTRPPQTERIAELVALRQEQLRELTEKTGVLDDARAELRRVEADVTVAEQRKNRDEERLIAATSPKDAQALERELDSLARRLHDLEDVQLDIMARVEDAEGIVAAQQSLIDATTAEGTALTAAAKGEMAAAGAEYERLAAERTTLSGSVAEALLADYDRRAQRNAGAALLRRGTCEGCRMVLPGTELNTIRQLADDVIVSCPECGCILVRTDESGI